MSNTQNPLHVDEWIENKHMSSEPNTEAEKMAMAFLFIKGLDAVSNMICTPLMKDIKIFCTFKNETYRVTGCSRLGDVWINSNLDEENGYTNRVNVEECSNWSTSIEKQEG